MDRGMNEMDIEYTKEKLNRLDALIDAVEAIEENTGDGDILAPLYALVIETLIIIWADLKNTFHKSLNK